jgi:hypothetical protein
VIKRAFVCPILAVFVSAEIRVRTVLGSIGCRMGTSDSAASATFTGIRGKSLPGRLPPIRNSASAKLSVIGNGNYSRKYAFSHRQETAALLGAAAEIQL